METLSFGVMALGGAIILGLAGYAAWLLLRLQRQTKRQKAAMISANAAMVDAIAQRNLKIIESVDVIARATLQEQCDLSEAAIRLYMIMSQLDGDKCIVFSTRFPALYELYEVVKDMPRGDARKSIQKQERMRFDMIRMKAQARLQVASFTELDEILLFTGAKTVSDSPVPELTL